MQLYILDDHGSVVFTYFSGEENRHDQKMNHNHQAQVIKIISAALKFIDRNFVIKKGEK